MISEMLPLSIYIERGRVSLTSLILKFCLRNGDEGELWLGRTLCLGHPSLILVWHFYCDVPPGIYFLPSEELKEESEPGMICLHLLFYQMHQETKSWLHEALRGTG